MEVKILGCNCGNKTAKLEANTREALAASGFEADADIEVITNTQAILSYGVMSTPALIVDNMLLVVGRVMSAKQIRSILESKFL